MISQIIPVVFILYFVADWNNCNIVIVYGSIFTNFCFSMIVLKEACRSTTFQKILTG